ncbi:hypothetical protein [Kutzneria sp. NPDC052558]|uniref:hypothetical protein n=1 Tax=Kutzneria sp. NPDC052558 TaxID=3364121 RepID=UPI0037C82CD6
MQEPWNTPTLLTTSLNLTEGSQTDREVVEMARELVRLESTVRATLSHVVAVMVGQGAHESFGHATTADLLRSEFHLSGREASELAVAAVRLREQLHCTFLALQAGLITWSHATTFVRAVDRLGMNAVSDTEHDWIERIATRTSPEVLQRVVHSRHLEQVGYPSPSTPEPGVDKGRRASSTASSGTPTDASTDASKAAGDSEGLGARDAEPVDQEPQPASSTDEQLQERDDFAKSTHVEPGAAADPRSAQSPVPTTAPTSTPSGDKASFAAETFATSFDGCLHPACVAEAFPREIAFTMRWLDGSVSTILGHSPACDEHAAELASRPVDRIRVGHGSGFRMIGPALVTDAA